MKMMRTTAMIASLFLRRRFHASPQGPGGGGRVPLSLAGDLSLRLHDLLVLLVVLSTSLTPYSFFPAPYLMRGSRNAYETSTMRLMTMTTTTMTVTEPMTMASRAA